MIPREIAIKRCQRPQDHRPHEPYVDYPGGPDLACPGGVLDPLEAALIELAVMAA